jgi:hypothetical protein
MIPGLLVASIQHYKENRHDGTCVELFQEIGRFEPSMIDAHQLLKLF